MSRTKRAQMNCPLGLYKKNTEDEVHTYIFVTKVHIALFFWIRSDQMSRFPKKKAFF